MASTRGKDYELFKEIV